MSKLYKYLNLLNLFAVLALYRQKGVKYLHSFHTHRRIKVSSACEFQCMEYLAYLPVEVVLLTDPGLSKHGGSNSRLQTNPKQYRHAQTTA